MLHSYSYCFRTAFNQCAEELKRKIAERFAQIVREENERIVFVHGFLFFRAHDLKYLNEEDVDLVKKYLLERVGREPLSWIATLEGIGAYLVREDIIKFIDPLVRTFLDSKANISGAARKLLLDEWDRIPKDAQPLFLQRLSKWIDFYNEKNDFQHALEINNLKSVLEEDDIPF